MFLRGILKGCSCFIITIFFIVITFLMTLFVKPSKLIISDDTISYIYPLAYENLISKIENFLKKGISQQSFSEVSFSELEINSGIYHALKNWKHSIFEKIVINIEKDKISIYGFITPLNLIKNSMKKNHTSKTKETKTKNFSKLKSTLSDFLKDSNLGISFSITFNTYINQKRIDIIPQKANIGLIPIPISVKLIKNLTKKLNVEINKNYESFKGNNKTYLKLTLSKRIITLKMEGKSNDKLQEEVPLQKFLKSPNYIYSGKDRKKIEKLLGDYEKNDKITPELIFEAKKLTKKRH